MMFYTLNIRKVDYVKIDVEGAELEVLNGMQRTLKESRQGLIKPSKECYEIPFIVLTSNYIINFLLVMILAQK